MDEYPRGWAIGWTAFAGFMMVMLGNWWIVAGLVAIVDDDFFVVTQEWIFKFSTTTWGWIHLGLGVIILLSGFGLFTANVWARTVGVLSAWSRRWSPLLGCPITRCGRSSSSPWRWRSSGHSPPTAATSPRSTPRSSSPPRDVRSWGAG